MTNREYFDEKFESATIEELKEVYWELVYQKHFSCSVCPHHSDEVIYVTDGGYGMHCPRKVHCRDSFKEFLDKERTDEHK